MDGCRNRKIRSNITRVLLLYEYGGNLCAVNLHTFSRWPYVLIFRFLFQCDLLINHTLSILMRKTPFPASSLCEAKISDPKFR